MTIKKWTLLILFIAGLVILLLPDKGVAVIVFNEKHGPSLLDLAGIGLIVISWALSSVVVVKKWEIIKAKMGDRNCRLLLIIYILSIIGIALSLRSSSDLLLWSCAAIGSFTNILFIIYALKNDSNAN